MHFCNLLSIGSTFIEPNAMVLRRRIGLCGQNRIMQSTGSSRISTAAWSAALVRRRAREPRRGLIMELVPGLCDNGFHLLASLDY